MTPQRAVTTLLLAFVAASIGYLVVSEMKSAPPTTSERDTEPIRTAEAPSTEPTHRVIAYYLHNTQRCQTCLKIERWSKNALTSKFPDALQRGTLVWRALDMEEPPNAHFATDYDLVTSSLVIVDLRDGEQQAFTVMDRVWELVHDDESEFQAYVAEQVRSYLGA